MSTKNTVKTFIPFVFIVFFVFGIFKIAYAYPARDFSVSPWVIYNGEPNVRTSTDLVFAVPNCDTVYFSFSIGTYQGASDILQAEEFDDQICQGTSIAYGGEYYTGIYKGWQIENTENGTEFDTGVAFNDYVYFNDLNVGTIKLQRQSLYVYTVVSSFFNSSAYTPITSSDPFIPEDCTTGDIVCGLSNFFGKAFHLDSSVFNQFDTLKENLRNKAPFGYVTATFDMINGLTTNTDDPEYILQEVTPITDEIFTPLRNGLTWILWFAFGFFLLKRFKDIQI
jgi:hypothetical protein